MNNLIIGIAGGSGSGKTTLALRLKERFGEDEVRLISHDTYAFGGDVEHAVSHRIRIKTHRR